MEVSKMETSELLSFLNRCLREEDDLMSETFDAALAEVEKRSPLLAVPYKVGL